MASKMKRSIVRRHRDRRSVHWASPSGRHGRDNGAAVLRTNCTGGLGGSRPTTAATNAKAEAPVAKAPFVDAYALRLDPSLGEGLDAQLLARDLWAPISRHEDGHYVVVTAQEPTEQRRQAVQRVLEAPVELAVTTKSGVFHVLSQICRGQLLDQASYGLWRDDEERSARKVLSRPQALSLVAALLALGYGLGFALRATLVTTSAVIACGFLVCVLFKFVVCLVGAYHENLLEVTDEDVAALTDANLPIYTVLVPCYREANVVPQLMANLAVLDYPQDKLDILLLLEEDDDETRVAAMAAEPPATVTFITVPKGQPQTKPKACNVGLIFARGEYLVIYDAEDRPDPDQLKKAVAAFRKGGPDLVCVQAALNYFNDEENALTRMFTLEYSFWFDYMLTGLSALDLPIPLGGTSNHFRTEDSEVARRMGSLQCDRGRRSRHPCRDARETGRRDPVHDVRGSEQLVPQLRQAAVPLGQRVPADHACEPAPPGPAGSERRLEAGARLRPPDRRHPSVFPGTDAALCPSRRLPCAAPDGIGFLLPWLGALGEPGQPTAR